MQQNSPERKRQAKRAVGREMLLPIAGEGNAKEPANEKTKEAARPAARQRKVADAKSVLKRLLRAAAGARFETAEPLGPAPYFNRSQL